MNCIIIDDDKLSTKIIAEFVEKPSEEVAQQYVSSGDYYWNSGMFLLGARTYLDELKKYVPEMLASVEKAFTNAAEDLDFIRLDKDTFTACPSDSIYSGGVYISYVPSNGHCLCIYSL